ncbi:MAG TPA: glycerate kinase [Deltaproteobacteria bacterium]|nr:glycerate kinase [Deltaproteobacteria bacterium]
MSSLPKILEQTLQVALQRSKPKNCMPEYLNEIQGNEKLPERIIVLGAGKASAAMANTLENHWKGTSWGAKLSGLVLTRYGYGEPCKSIEIVEASHPVPDEKGQITARRILDLAESANDQDLVIWLVSGGGSALLTLPCRGLTLQDKQSLNRSLLHSGATIEEMNCVRKHLSAIKGGRLARAIQPARLWTLAISDVPGDYFSVIASGPTVPDPTTFADAQEILRRYQIQPTQAIQKLLEAAEEETPKPGEDFFSKNQARLVATPQLMLEAAAKEAEKQGIKPIILSDRIEGEAKEVAKVHAAIAKQIKHRDQPINSPAVILSGGETTVTVHGKGKGGRNTEFILSLLEALQGDEEISAIAVDTDGIDGTEDNAGAWIDHNTFFKAKQLNLKTNDFLDNNDAYTFFKQLDHLVITGPTMTNVNDFRAIFIGQP